MKVIFLDIDGVLNGYPYILTAEAQWEHHCDLLDKNTGASGSLRQYHDCAHLNLDCVARLRKVVETTEAYIVISSTWRMHHTLESIRFVFGLRGFHNLEDRIIGLTNTDHRGQRGPQIQDYLNEHPEIESFVILDDEIGGMQHFTDIVLQTRLWGDGMQDYHVDEAISRLSNGG